MIDLDEPRFTMSQVARATRGKANTIFSWFQRGHFALGKKDVQAENGLGHGISLRTALEVGIAVELYKQCDLHPAIGAKLAREFTQLGDDHRDPGELFPQDATGRVFTVLVVYPGLEHAKVVRMTPKTAMVDAFIADQYGRQTAATLIWLNFIDRDLRVALLQDGKEA